MPTVPPDFSQAPPSVSDEIGPVRFASEGEIGSMVDAYAGRLMPGVQVNTFRNADRPFPTRTVARGGIVRPLHYAAKSLRDVPIRSGGVDFDLYDYVSRNRVGGLLVMHRGEVMLEQYELGLDPMTRWPSMSVAKSVTTTLIGAAVHDGSIGSVDDVVAQYVPRLAGSVYGDVSIRHVMQMTSGVRWDDTHTDPASERRKMLDLQNAQQPDAIVELLASLPRVAKPGTLWNYSTGETHILGVILREATGKWLADYLSDKIWSRLGMEREASWWLEAPGGLEVAGSGILATLRDYARFGQFMALDGVIDGTRVLPKGWTREAGSSHMIGGNRQDYGYMWWAVPDRNGSLADIAFAARGIFGQFIYINPVKDVVITVLSSRSKPKFAEAIIDNDFFNSVVAVLGQEESLR